MDPSEDSNNIENNTNDQPVDEPIEPEPDNTQDQPNTNTPPPEDNNNDENVDLNNPTSPPPPQDNADNEDGEIIDTEPPQDINEDENPNINPSTPPTQTPPPATPPQDENQSNPTTPPQQEPEPEPEPTEPEPEPEPLEQEPEGEGEAEPEQQEQDYENTGEGEGEGNYENEGEGEGGEGNYGNEGEGEGEGGEGDYGNEGEGDYNEEGDEDNGNTTPTPPPKQLDPDLLPDMPSEEDNGNNEGDNYNYDYENDGNYNNDNNGEGEDEENEEGEEAPPAIPHTHWASAAEDADNNDGNGDDDDNNNNEDDEEEEEEEEDDELPIFANRENRELQADVEKKEAKLEALLNTVAEHAERVQVIKEHLKNVQNEIENTQSLYNAKMKEMETEDHLRQIAERERGRIRQELTQMKRELEDIQDRSNIIQNSIFQGNNQMDQFRAQMNMNQEELEEWALAAKQKEEDHNALSKYEHVDDAKLHNLLIEVEKVTVSVQNAHKILDDAITETQSKQIELDKTAEEFRNLHKERQNLIRQWTDAVDTMKRRDDDINRVGMEFANLVQATNEKKQLVKEHNKMLDEELKNNAKVQGEITLKERQIAEMRVNWAEITNNLQLFKDQVEVTHNELAKTASELTYQKTQIQNLLQELEDKKSRMINSRNRFQKEQSQYEKEVKSTMTAEEVAAKAEKTLQDREYALERITKQLELMKQKQFNESQKLFELRQREANLISEIAGTEASNKHMTVQIHKLDQESLKQQELIYNAEFQIQQMERKVARAQGVRSDEEKAELKKRIAQLEENLYDRMSQKKILDGQVKRLHMEMNKANRRLQDLNEEKIKGENAIKEKKLQISTAEIELKKLSSTKDDLVVQHDLLELEVKKLRDQLDERANQVFGLENRKEQLALSMEQRKKEIQVHLDTQEAEKKVLEEERHKISVELAERSIKLDTLKAKYDTLSAMAPYGDEGPQSQAYYVIKAAQKREELQRKGDELDHNIRVAEKEIRALQATLKHLNKQNTQYREGFAIVDRNSSDAMGVKNLRDKLVTASDVLFKRQKELQRIHNDLNEDKNRLKDLENENEENVNDYKRKEEINNSLDVEIHEKEGKMSELNRKVRSQSVFYRRTCGNSADEETIAEKAIRSMEMKDANDNILYCLNELVKEYPEMNSGLRSELEDSNLEIPLRPPSRMNGSH